MIFLYNSRYFLHVCYFLCTLLFVSFIYCLLFKVHFNHFITTSTSTTTHPFFPLSGCCYSLFPPVSSLHFYSISLCASHRITTYDILFYNNIFPLFITTRKIHKNVLSFRFIGRYVRVGVFYVYYTFYILGVKNG